jgi:NADH dehydrogenase FAD-containing subunit
LLIHGGPDLVPAFDKDLQAHALHASQKKGVEVRLDACTAEVGDCFVALKDKHAGEEEAVPVGISVWAAGVQAVPFIRKCSINFPNRPWAKMAASMSMKACTLRGFTRIKLRLGRRRCRSR